MVAETIKCKKHKVTFRLSEGCPLCIEERRAEVNSPENIAKRIEAVNESGSAGDVPASFSVGGTADSNARRTGEEEVRTEPETAVALRPFEDYEAHDCFLESERVLELAKSRVVTTLEESKLANDDLALISKLTKLMDGKQKALLAPHKVETDAIRGTYKYLMAPIIEANSITKSKMLAFDTKQRQIQQEQERINQQRLAAARAEMDLKGELSESVNLVEVKKAPERVKTELGTSFKTDRWKYRIVNLDLVPREWMIPAHDMLSSRATKNHDTMPVPGIEFYNDPYYKVRTK